MFKTTSLCIKAVCLNDTYNLSLISGAYNNFDFFLYIRNTQVKNANFGLSWWGMGVGQPKGFIFFMCSFEDIPRV